MKKQLVIGCGTGRCGTTTLARLLNMQPGAAVTHERLASKFHWNKPAEAQHKIMKTLVAMTEGLVGDVALQHGCCLQWWCEVGAKVVVMKRDMEGYLASWKKKAGLRNNWQPPREGGTAGSRWYKAFPKFAGLSGREEALKAYYNFYYDELVPPVVQQYPDQVLLCHVDVFNTARGQQHLLDFCGVPREEQVLKVGLKKNRLAS